MSFGSFVLLPNITGQAGNSNRTFGKNGASQGTVYSKGALKQVEQLGSQWIGGTTHTYENAFITFDASNSNSIYGLSDTVRKLPIT